MLAVYNYQGQAQVPAGDLTLTLPVNFDFYLAEDADESLLHMAREALGMFMMAARLDQLRVALDTQELGLGSSTEGDEAEPSE